MLQLIQRGTTKFPEGCYNNDDRILIDSKTKTFHIQIQPKMTKASRMREDRSKSPMKRVPDEDALKEVEEKKNNVKEENYYEKEERPRAARSRERNHAPDSPRKRTKSPRKKPESLYKEIQEEKDEDSGYGPTNEDLEEKWGV